jgi:hypothetical protein
MLRTRRTLIHQLCICLRPFVSELGTSASPSFWEVSLQGKPPADKTDRSVGDEPHFPVPCEETQLCPERVSSWILHTVQ